MHQMSVQACRTPRCHSRALPDIAMIVWGPCTVLLSPGNPKMANWHEQPSMWHTPLDRIQQDLLQCNPLEGRVLHLIMHTHSHRPWCVRGFTGFTQTDIVTHLEGKLWHR